MRCARLGRKGQPKLSVCVRAPRESHRFMYRKFEFAGAGRAPQEVQQVPCRTLRATDRRRSSNRSTLNCRYFTTPVRTSDGIRIDSYVARDAPVWVKNHALRTDSGSSVRLMARSITPGRPTRIGRAGLHRRPGHGRRDFRDQARIEGLGDQLLRTEGQVLDATTVGRGNKFALLLPCQLGDGRAERCARQLGIPQSGLRRRPHAGEVRARPGFGSFIRTCRPNRYCMC